MASLARPRGRLRSAALLLLLLALAADQVVLRTALADGRFLGRRIAPYDPPLFSQPQERDLETLKRHLATGDPPASALHFDAELGWCPRAEGSFGADRFDWAGARLAGQELAREKRPGERRVLALGCSFTFGEEVRSAESWPAQLDALRADLELANLGVSAYGLDQALLRYRRDGRRLAADEVWLGFLPTAALRVTTLYRPAARHWAHLALFKPCFELSRGELLLVPNPATSIERTVELLGDQREFLAALEPHDRWVRRWPAAWAPEGSRLAHHSALGRLLLTALEVRGRDPLRALREREEGVFDLLVAIVTKLAREARADGARLRFVILPGVEELADLRARGSASWGPLCAELERAGVAVWDLSAELLELDLRAPGRLWAPNQHYSPEGNLRVAELLARRCE